MINKIKPFLDITRKQMTEIVIEKYTDILYVVVWNASKKIFKMKCFHALAILTVFKQFKTLLLLIMILHLLSFRISLKKIKIINIQITIFLVIFKRFLLIINSF